MPVMQCAGTAGCGRLISVSAVPGGNPAAKADPEGFASEWTLCAGCRGYTCDRCLGKQHGRCRCGAAVKLFTEAQRIQVATNLMQGKPAIAGAPAPAAGAPAAAPAPGPAVMKPAGAGLPPGLTLRALLEGMLQQVDLDLSQKNEQKARAMAALSASMMEQHADTAPQADAQWLSQFGESYYRWRFFPEGVSFYRGVYAVLKRHGINQTPLGDRSVAIQSAYILLGSDPTKLDLDTKQRCLGYTQKILGADHVLAREAAQRVGPLQAPPAAPAGAAAAVAPVAVRVSLPAGPASSAFGLGSIDPSTRLALWVTLAFMDMAGADGTVGDKEYAVWANAMKTMQLPDVLTRYGAPKLGEMLRAGVLQELSVTVAQMPSDQRSRLAGLLIEIMMADGKAEPAEIQALRRIGGWIGVSMQFG